MRKTITKLLIIISTFIGVMAPALPVYAAGGSISLTASRSTIASGGTVIIAVYANGGGTGINAVQADLNYPASKLQYIGFSASGSAFEIGANSGGGDGLASLSRGTINSVGGSALVGTVTFKALVGSGSAAISIAGSSALVSDGNPVPYSPSGVSVNFGAAAAAPSGPATKAAPAAPVAPEPPKDTAAPLVTAVKVTALTPFSATITWTTNEPADSTVDFGVDTKYGLSSSASAPSTAHAVPLSSSFLTPLTLLHYRVKSTDGSGNATSSPDQSFQLPGVPVTIIVRGPDGKPQEGAVVTLDSQTGTTDGKGSITLRSSLGNKRLTTTYQGVTVQKPISVNRTTKPLPPYQLDLSKRPLNPWMLTSAGLLSIVLILIAIDAVLFGSRILARLTGLHFVQSLHHEPAVEPTPKAALEPQPTIEPSIEDIPLDPSASIAELMGEEPVLRTVPIPDTPIVMSLQPAPGTNWADPQKTEPPKSTAPLITVLPVNPTDTTASHLASRLKVQPAARPHAIKKHVTKAAKTIKIKGTVV